MTSLSSLSLRNFRYHQSLDLDIPSGTIQFKGDSGSGKSSAAASISYGLFGKVWKTKNLVAYGEKAFSVKLTLTNASHAYTIFRKNTPKTLKLRRDGTLIASGDKAEELIAKLVGVNYSQYVWGMALRADHSILEISPQEKYEGVCALAGVDKEVISEKMKDITLMISSAEKRLAVLVVKKGRLEGIIKTLKTSQCKFEEDGVPDLVDLEGPPGGELEDLQEIDERLSQIEETLANFGDSERATLEKEIFTLESRLTSIKETLELTEGYDGNFLSTARLANELVKTRKELQSVMKTVKEEGVKRKKEILAYYDEVLPAKVEPDQYREWVAVLRERWSTFNRLTSEIEKISKSQKSAKESMLKIFRKIGTTFSVSAPKTTKDALATLNLQRIKLSPKFCCPSCSSTLVFGDGGLALVDADEGEAEASDSPEGDLDLVETWTADLQKLQPLATQEIPSPPTRPKTLLDKAEVILSEIEKKQAEIRSIDTGSSPLITRVRAKLDKLEKEFAKDPSGEEIDLDEISDDLVSEYVATTKERTVALATRKKLSDQLVSLKKKLTSSESIESLLEEASSLREKKESVLVSQREREEIEKSNARANDYLGLVKQIEKETKELGKVVGEIKTLENNVIGLKGLKLKIKEAVLLSIEETIVGINEEARKFLEQLFDSGPSAGLQVSLGLSTKIEGKVITRVVRPFSKNSEAGEESTSFEEGKYEDLSDGEKQRSRLAFFLGVNAYLEPKLNLIVIDEALNQVEEALNSKSISLIRDSMGGEGTKIVISHEAISGQFDEVVDF